MSKASTAVLNISYAKQVILSSVLSQIASLNTFLDVSRLQVLRREVVAPDQCSNCNNLYKRCVKREDTAATVNITYSLRSVFPRYTSDESDARAVLLFLTVEKYSRINSNLR